jgi:uncharacterized LabA/DUF88 family protein
MSRGPKRRAMLFIDGSALRDTLKGEFYSEFGVGLEARIDYHRLGLLLCGDIREFIRVNYYTSVPATYRIADGKKLMGSFELHPHEAFKTDRAGQRFNELKIHLTNTCKFTRLVTGRLVARRSGSYIRPAFDWAKEVIEGASGGHLSESDRALMDRALTVNIQAREARSELAARITQLLDERRIPGHLMGSYNRFLADLLGQYIDFQEKGVDTSLAVDMLELCMNDAFDDAFLLAADEDFVPMVEAVKRTGRHVIHTFVELPENGGYGFFLRSACDDHRVITKDELRSLQISSTTAPTTR